MKKPNKKVFNEKVFWEQFKWPTPEQSKQMVDTILKDVIK
jgi:hypothetical protein